MNKQAAQVFGENKAQKLLNVRHQWQADITGKTEP